MMRPSLLRAIVALSVLAAPPLGAQATPPAATPGVQTSGPLIHSAGPSALVPDATFLAPAGHHYRVVWEINAHGDSTRQNAQFGTLARFYNLHARHGVPKENLHAAAVVHGTGWMALLSDSAYTARFGRANPSKALIEELLAHGAQIVVCGQTAAFRGIARAELLPGVHLGISAMTALSAFYAQGYHLQPWR